MVELFKREGPLMQALTHCFFESQTGTILDRPPVQTASPAQRGVGRLWITELTKLLTPKGALDRRRYSNLSSRERMVLQLLGQGLSNKETAKRLGISPETVKSHVKNIFLKLGVDRRAQAVSRGVGLGVITPA